MNAPTRISLDVPRPLTAEEMQQVRKKIDTLVGKTRKVEYKDNPGKIEK